MAWITTNSPVGPLTLFAEDDALVAIEWGWPPDGDAPPGPLLEEARDQLDAYFAGKLQRFDLPLAPAGTAFQRQVWTVLSDISFGTVRYYGDVARQIGSAPRSVGTACGRNPIPIVIPCHRVIGAGGRLGGYSGMDGIDTKRFLLRHEGVIIA